MKPNIAGDDMQLRAETANEKLKQHAQRQDSDGMQSQSVLYMTQLRSGRFGHMTFSAVKSGFGHKILGCFGPAGRFGRSFKSFRP